MSQTLITAGRVLTGPKGEHVTDGAVLTDGSAIVAAGPRGAVEPMAPAGARRLALPDTTVLPGLIDAHVHLVFDASKDPVAVLDAHDDGTLMTAMEERARQFLHSGVTTVRDLGDRDRITLRLRAAIAAGSVPGPRVLAATTPITSKGGHCWFLGGEVEGEDEIRALVRRNVELGADVIKVMATGGGLTHGGPAAWQAQFGAPEIRAVVREAHGAGLPVAAHGHGTAGIVAAVMAGVDTIEHCTWMNRKGIGLREDVLDAIVDKGIRICPTVSPDWRMLPMFFGAERAKAMFDQVRTMAEHGARLIAGTDAGVQRAGCDGLAQSLGFYQHLGLAPDRVLDMATTEAADALGIADHVGRLAAGYRADIVAVGGDPLKDVAALEDVRMVMANGAIVHGAGGIDGKMVDRG
ncbi:amidohydrolase family protein [Streptomyces sp. NPDC050658]|uniref:amidohydrolase family protein n=1 Tax=unclassified Streptomyces TaxID=2593676 RepID=UPI00342F2D58